MKKNVLLGMIIVMTMLLVCACTVDEPCAYCNRKPSVEYELSDGSTIYVCEKCSSKCMQCGADAITHYENLPDIVFVCDACEAEYEIKQIDNVTAELENTMDEVGKSFTGNGDKTETQKEVEQEEIEKLTDGYYILEVFEDKIENKTDKIWVFARDTRKEFETTDYYMLIDLENNIYAKIEAKDEMRWINNIEDKAIIVYNSDVDKYYILDTQGKNLEYKYCNNDDEKIVFIAEKSEESIIWTQMEESTFDKYDVYLRAYDVDGNLKAEWSAEQLKEENGLDLVNMDAEELSYVGGSVYKLDRCGYGEEVYNVSDIYNIYLDIENKISYIVQVHNTANGGGNSSNDGTYTLYYQERDMVVFDDTGRIVGNGIKCKDWLYPAGEIGDGLFYAHQADLNGRGGYCIVNSSGDIQFYFKYEPRNFPCYYSGRAALTMDGAGGVAYTTLVDKDGNWLFEPVKGHHIEYCEALDKHIIEDENQRYLLNDNGDKIQYPSVKVECWIVEERNIEYAYLLDGTLCIEALDY